MTEDKLKNLLQEADRIAGPPKPVGVSLSTIRRRVKYRWIFFKVPVAAAAVLLIAAGILSYIIKTPQTSDRQEKIASLENQIRQLQASTDAAINLIHEVLEKERQQNRLNELQAQLAAMPDPLEEIQQQVDKTAFILVYQADRMYRELNQTESAVETYKRVIQLFPENQWAQVARQRLAQIKEKQSGKIDLKGESKWKPQNILS
jgi:tetratricopeptide (TPR) repeat protein